MDTFAFIIHPIDPKRDVSRKFPLLGRALSVEQINFFSTFFPPVYISTITGIRSAATGKEIKGWFVACPYTPQRMLELPERTVYAKIVQTGKLAQKLGAQVLGLGAFTSVVGDAGVTIAKQLSIPVTTGDSYTVAVAVEARARRRTADGDSASHRQRGCRRRDRRNWRGGRRADRPRCANAVAGGSPSRCAGSRTRPDHDAVVAADLAGAGRDRD
jgi:Predicted dehydrogenase